MTDLRSPMSDDYPVRSARTRRFTLGAPRDVTIVGPAGSRSVLMLRSDAGDDPVQHLWRVDPATGDEVRLLDARTFGVSDTELPAEERARRERVREQAGGVTAYTVDRDGRRVACALGGRLVIVDVEAASARAVPLDVAVFDPRIAPDGRRVALHHDDGVSVVDLDESHPTLRRLVEEPGAVWGRAEFIAAEEMGRQRGMWWSPCSTRLAVERFDDSSVTRVHLADLAQPERAPNVVAYPFAGTANVAVELAIVDVDTGEREALGLAAVGGDDAEYLARVAWDVEPLLVVLQPRDQQAAHVFARESSGLRSVRRITGEPWVELVSGAPAWLGGLLTVEDVEDDGVLRRALCRDGEPLTPPGMQVRAVLAVHRDPDGRSGRVVLSTSTGDPTSIDVQLVHIADEIAVERLSDAVPGVHHAVVAFDAGGAIEVVAHRRADLSHDGSVVELETWTGGSSHRRPITSFALPSGLASTVQMLELGPRGLRAALVLPAEPSRHVSPLPVVLDPYGGPHAQRVLAARAAFHGSQWLADQGFAVLVVDGRGTPGRGPRFEHAVHRDLAGPALEDQLAALDALGERAESAGLLDTSRVGIRGWSYGGTLAALAALRRPDRIRCAIVGAPVTDWHLYDTHYTERYLGHPDTDPEAYLRSAVVGPDGTLVAADPPAVDAPPAALLLVHGLVDDNVLAAHSLRLTEALQAQGRPFAFLPLTSATHMASDPAVAARLLEAQATFLQRSLGR